MPDFNIRSESIDVEQIMEQIRARIREKRGVDYTEQQLRELAAVKLEKFLDPRGIRSDLLEQFKRGQPRYEPPVLPNYEFEDATIFESHRAPLRWIRRLLQPILKLFFNPNPLIRALHIQAQLNTTYAEREAQREAARHALDQLQYELIHNLVVEITRLGIEVKNLKMRIESLTSRLEFNERRARALESAVVYRSPDEEQTDSSERPGALSRSLAAVVESPSTVIPVPAGGAGMTGTPEGPGQRSRRRRRRRGRRGPPAVASAGSESTPFESRPDESDAVGHAETAETIERTLPPESQSGESPEGFESAPPAPDSTGSGGPEPDKQ